MKDKCLNYPNQKFTDDAQSELSKLNDFAVMVNSKFSRFLLGRAIDSWPRLLNDVDRVRSKNHGYMQLSMLFLPKLWFINMLAIGSGYIMNYSIDDGKIMIIYSYK